MKSVLFDVDGVFLSEERCFDVSALTTYEILMDKSYLGLDASIDFQSLNDEDIQKIRAIVFDHDKILVKLKSLGLNSNWDMLFIVTALHFIEVCKQLSSAQLDTVLNAETFSQQTLQEVGTSVSDIQLDFKAPLTFLADVKPGKDHVYQALIAYAQKVLNTSHTELFELKSPFWLLTQEVYQEWYLGCKLFKEVEQKENRATSRKRKVQLSC